MEKWSLTTGTSKVDGSSNSHRLYRLIPRFLITVMSSANQLEPISHMILHLWSRREYYN